MLSGARLVAFGLAATIVACAIPQRVGALSCYRSPRFYVIDCGGGRCLPLFRTDFSGSYGCSGRTLLRDIEDWELDAFSAELERRGVEPNGVIRLFVAGGRLFPPEYEEEHLSQLWSIRIEAFEGSSEEVRREWKTKARRELGAVLLMRLPIWILFFALVLAATLATRSALRDARAARDHATKRSPSGAAVLALIAALGGSVLPLLDDPIGVRQGLWPLVLAGFIAAALLLGTLVAARVSRPRAE